MALGENTTLKEIVDETERLNNAIIGRITPNVGTYSSGHYMTSAIEVGNFSGTGGNCAYFKVPRNHYLKDVDWVMSSTPDLIENNIRSGKNILGKIGTLVEGKRVASGSAYPSNTLPAKYYNYFDGSQVGFSNILINTGWAASHIVLLASNPQDNLETLVVYTNQQGVFGAGSVKYSIYYKIGKTYDTAYLYNLQPNSIFNPSTGVYYMPISLSVGTIRWFAVEA